MMTTAAILIWLAREKMADQLPWWVFVALLMDMVADAPKVGDVIERVFAHL